ncbi:histidine biosynthesis protein [Acidianus hospitalis W1]|uniref:Histidine biosynthesis protein n=1 Tax=Acidianus hospitalis (strain W1) TaxID=933801 RepID=F4BA36_ACIHW|nr:1-(5-phosphoribosyl)-5-((5-phosphoribosylamino)methylideneamino)imidazole-4-carboxamide isomerase [Acidianus hospitalis]AEE94033.1 histidine biosynthesis protein [Acidianus hospitalis W1]
MMYVVPSIDISQGKAVKRVRGVKGTGIIIGDPIKVAENIYSLGYDTVHIVDLDAAENLGNNEEIIAGIARIGFKRIEVGGGIRSIEKANRMLSLGITEIVVSSILFTNKEEFDKMSELLGDRLFFSIDYCEGKTLIKGWKEEAKSVDETISLLKNYDIKGVIFTYVCNEGTKKGIDENISMYSSRVNKLKGYAGGINNINDLLKLKESKIDFAIVGMSFYSGSLKGVKYV